MPSQTTRGRGTIVLDRVPGRTEDVGGCCGGGRGNNEALGGEGATSPPPPLPYHRVAADPTRNADE